MVACCVQGAYWTLEKRRDDLHNMHKEWNKVVLGFTETFPDIFTRRSVKASLKCQPGAVEQCMVVDFTLYVHLSLRILLINLSEIACMHSSQYCVQQITQGELHIAGTWPASGSSCR